MNNYKHITACNKPFPDIWTGAWKLKQGIHSSSTSQSQSILLFADLTLHIAHGPGCRSRVQQTITTTKYYSTQQFSTSFPLINIQREHDNSTCSGKSAWNEHGSKDQIFFKIHCFMVFLLLNVSLGLSLFLWTFVSFGIFVHKFKLQLHRAYCWK